MMSEDDDFFDGAAYASAPSTNSQFAAAEVCIAIYIC